MTKGVPVIGLGESHPNSFKKSKHRLIEHASTLNCLSTYRFVSVRNTTP